MDRRAWRIMVHGVAKQSVGHNLATNQPTIKMTALLLFNLPPTVLYPQPYYQDSKAPYFLSGSALRTQQASFPQLSTTSLPHQVSLPVKGREM